MILRLRSNSPNRRKKHQTEGNCAEICATICREQTFFSSVSLYVNKLSVAITVVMLIHLSTMIWQVAAGKFEPNLAASLDQTRAHVNLLPFLGYSLGWQHPLRLQKRDGWLMLCVCAMCAQIYLWLTSWKAATLTTKTWYLKSAECRPMFRGKTKSPIFLSVFFFFMKLCNTT